MNIQNYFTPILVTVLVLSACAPSRRQTPSIPTQPSTEIKSTETPEFTPTATLPITDTPQPGNWTVVENWTPANQIRTMLIDQSGNLWTGGPAGVVHWDLNTDTSSVYAIREDPEHTNVVALSQTPDGSIWAGTSGNGLARFDGTNWQSFTTEDGLPGNYINDQTVTPDGELWLVIKEQEFDSEPNQKIHLGHFDGKVWLEDLDVPSFTWLVASQNGSLISGVASNTYNPPNSNLWIYDRHDRKSWKSLVFDVPGNRPLREQGITAITVAPDAAIWVATWDAVLRYENGSWVKIASPLEKEELPQVSSIAVSANGTAWFGFSIRQAEFNKCGVHFDYRDFPEQGLYRYDGKTWTHFTTEDGLVDNKICTITLDSSGNAWFGSFDKGISRFDGERWISFVIR